MFDEFFRSNSSGAQRQFPSRRGVLQLAGFGVMSAGAAAALSACGGSSSGGSAAAPSSKASGAAKAKTSFALGTALSDNYILDLVSIDQKLWTDYNLNTNVQYPTSGVQGMQLMSSGTLNGSIQDCMLCIAGYVNGQAGKRPQIIGMPVPENTYSVVIGKGGNWPAASASYTQKMQALKGKRVGVAAIGSGSDRQLDLALSAAGMQSGDVTHLGVGQQTAGLAQLKAGKLDAYIGLTYATSDMIAAATGGKVYIRLGDPAQAPALLSGQQVDPMIVGEGFLNAHPDGVQAWLNTYTAAKAWIIANPAAAASLLNSKALGGNSADIATQYITHFTGTLMPKTNPDWKVSESAMTRMLDIAVQLGVMKTGQVTYEQLVPEFARA